MKKVLLFLLLLGTIGFCKDVDPFMSVERNVSILTTQTTVNITARAFYVIQPTDGDVWVSLTGVTADSRLYVSNKQVIDTETLFKSGDIIYMTAVTATTNVYIGSYAR